MRSARLSRAGGWPGQDGGAASPRVTAPHPQLIPTATHAPQAPDFLAPGAYIIGDVRFGRRCSVWFNAVLRGDINRVALGDDCNIQDLACLHVSAAHAAILGDRVSLGHAAIVHAATVGDGTLVGMGARVLDGAVIGRGCLVAAGCVVAEGAAIPDDHLVAGLPGAQVLKPLRPETRERIAAIAGKYVAYQQLYPTLRGDAC